MVIRNIFVLEDDDIKNHFYKLNESDSIRLTKKFSSSNSNHAFNNTQFFNKFSKKISIEKGHIVANSKNEKFFVYYIDKDCINLIKVGNFPKNECSVKINDSCYIYCDETISINDIDGYSFCFESQNKLQDAIKKKMEFIKSESKKQKKVRNKEKQISELFVGDVIIVDGIKRVIILIENGTLFTALFQTRRANTINSFNISYKYQAIDHISNKELLNIYKEVSEYIKFYCKKDVSNKLLEQESLIRSRVENNNI